MATALNQYATKVFSEQTSGLWALDDQVDYISLISSSERDFSTWTSVGVDSVVDATDDEVFDTVPPALPLESEFINGIISSSDNNGLVQFYTSRQYQPADFSTNIKTFAMGLYIYTYSKVADIRLGYRYTNPTTSEVEEVIKAASASTTLAWASISESFELPTSFENLELIVEVYYDPDGSNYEFSITRITAGQWAEEFHLKSVGLDTFVDMSATNIAVDPNQEGVLAQPYGLSGNSGYYLIRNKDILAKNNAMPLVYGSDNSTKVVPNVEGEPSLIVPGLGFMNQSTSNISLTAEFWIAIFSQSTQSRKIFGPIGSADGLYVEGPFLKFKIGNFYISHFVREWFRPMLVDIRISPTSASLLINGESVGTLEFQNSPPTLPNPLDTNGKDQDWLGFYAYDDVPYLLVDCVAIYPYTVPSIVAKRRWGYGQAVDFPVDVKGLDSSKTISVDYPFAEYHKNYSFPETSTWINGTHENLLVEQDFISAPEYSLPTVKFSNKEEGQWLADLGTANSSLTDTFISLRPDRFSSQVDQASWQSTSGYMLFDNFDFLQEKTKAVYGIFETEQNYMQKQTLFKIVNEINGNFVEIYLAPYTYADEYTSEDETEINIYYAFSSINTDGTITEEIFYQSRGQRVGDRFLVGLDIDRFIDHYAQDVSFYLGSTQNLKVYVGGTPNFQNTYQGKIRRIAFCNKSNLNKIRHFFSERGVPVDYENVFNFFNEEVYDAGDSYFGNGESFWSLVLDGGSPYDFVTIGTEEHTASYTLMGKNTLGGYRLEIDTNSFWQSYLPLSYFSKKITDPFGKDYRSVSFVQVNLDYPSLHLKNGNVINNNGSQVRCYVSFQYSDQREQTELSTVLYSSFTKKQELDANLIVEPGSDWMNTLYEVTDGTIVYLPQSVNYDQLSLYLHIELINENSINERIRVRSLELSSQSYQNSPTEIGTRFGNKIVPFSKSGSYFNYQNVAPIQINKRSVPYLYQSEQSGIKMLLDYNNANTYGLSTKINQNATAFAKLSSFQLAIRYEEDLMPQAPIKIFELETASSIIEFFLVADSKDRTRGQIYALQAGTNRLQPGIVFFNNGKIAKRPVVYPNTWLMLGVSFPDFLDIGGVFGAFRITSPLRFNNITFYQTTIADDEERFGFRQWFSVRNTLGTDLDWGYWAGKELVGGEVVAIPGAGFTWQEVLFLSALLREEVDASVIYKIYTGTARIIADSDNNLTIQDYEYNFFNGLSWKQNVVTAV